MRWAWAKGILTFARGSFAIRDPRERLVATLLLAGSFALRVWKLTDQSLWYDEAMTVYWASQPLTRILHVGLTLSQDPHPPLYYLTVKPLVHLRPYEVWLRLPSVFWGTLLVAVGWRWARTHIGRTAAWFVALFLTLNPILVWYSQEARMYAQAITLTLLAWWFLSRWLSTGKAHSFAYSSTALGAVYTYLLSVLWLPTHMVAALLAPRSSRQKRGALLALGTVVVFSLPLAWRAWSGSGHTVPPHAPGNITAAIYALWRAWLIWKGHLPAWVAKLYFLVLALLPLVLLLPGKTGKGHRLWVALGTVPFLTGLFLTLRDPIVIVEPRYLLIAFPALVFVWGYAVQWLVERRTGVGLTLIVAILVGQLWALPQNWAPEHRREDWRYTARYLETHAGPKDAVLVHPDYVRPALDIYLRHPLPVYTPFHDYVTAQVVAPPLRGLLPLYDTLWLVESHTQTFDPQHLVRAWLTERFPLVTAQYPAGIALHGYAIKYRFSTLPSHIPPIEGAFRNGLTLRGCRIWDTRVKARDDRAHPPSGWVHVSLYWTTTTAGVENVRSRVWLTNAKGVWGVQLERNESIWNVYPPQRWRPQEIVRDEEDVNLNPITPPGVYTLLVGLEKPDGHPVLLTNGEPWVVCGEVRVR